MRLLYCFVVVEGVHVAFNSNSLCNYFLGMMALIEGSAEARTLQECYATLVEAIQDPDTLAGILFSKGVLSQEIMLELYAPQLSKAQKNHKILQCVQSRVVSDPSSLWTFISILRCAPSTDYLANLLVDTFRCEFSVVLM